jgi:hypothetical protein
MECHIARGVEFTVMRVVGNVPDVSAEVSGGTSGGVSGGFKICMYGKSGGFASRPSGQPKIPNKIIIFLSLRLGVGRRVTCETKKFPHLLLRNLYDSLGPP